MKLKYPLICLLIVLGLLAALKWRRDAWHAQSHKRISILSPETRLEDVASITIEKGGSTLTLLRADQAWTIQESNNHQADAQKVLLFLSDLYQANVTDILPDEPLEAVGLTPESGAISVMLLDNTGCVLAAFLFGKQIRVKAKMQTVSAGRWLLYNGKPAKVANPFPYIDLEPKGWQ